MRNAKQSHARTRRARGVGTARRHRKSCRAAVGGDCQSVYRLRAISHACNASPRRILVRCLLVRAGKFELAPCVQRGILAGHAHPQLRVAIHARGGEAVTRCALAWHRDKASRRGSMRFIRKSDGLVQIRRIFFAATLPESKHIRGATLRSGVRVPIDGCERLAVSGEGEKRNMWREGGHSASRRRPRRGIDGSERGVFGPHSAARTHREHPRMRIICDVPELQRRARARGCG